MKKIYTLLTLFLSLLTFAQAPQGFNYQATVRNSSGNLIVNQNVTFRFNLIQNSPTAVPVYSETHYVSTDDLGAVNLVIGQGTPTTGTFSSINWGTGNYYMGIELNTGNGFIAMGTNQLLSVPYALYAANTGVLGVTSPQGGNKAVVAYRIKVNMINGGIDATTPIAKVWAPGNIEIYDSLTGWSISGWSIVNSSNNLTLSHDLGKPVLIGTTTSLNGVNLFTIPFSSKSSSTGSVLNSVSNASVKFTGIDNINTGVSTAGASYVIITFFVES